MKRPHVNKSGRNLRCCGTKDFLDAGRSEEAEDEGKDSRGTGNDTEPGSHVLDDIQDGNADDGQHRGRKSLTRADNLNDALIAVEDRVTEVIAILFFLRDHVNLESLGVLYESRWNSHADVDRWPCDRAQPE